MSKILILALSLYSGIITASEDTDKHPECPYVLEEGEDCIDKALKIIDIEEHLKKSEKDAVKDVKDVPEPEALLSVILGGLYLLTRRKG